MKEGAFSPAGKEEENPQCRTGRVPSQGFEQVPCQKPGIKDFTLGNFVSACVFSQIFL